MKLCTHTQTVLGALFSLPAADQVLRFTSKMSPECLMSFRADWILWALSSSVNSLIGEFSI